jgi:hypothetical protein
MPPKRPEPDPPASGKPASDARLRAMARVYRRFRAAHADGKWTPEDLAVCQAMGQTIFNLSREDYPRFEAMIKDLTATEAGRPGRDEALGVVANPHPS